MKRSSWGQKKGNTMGKEEIEKQLDALISGEIEELTIHKEDFLIFRECWIKHPQKKAIVGYAKRGGDVEYHFQPHENESKLE